MLFQRSLRAAIAASLITATATAQLYGISQTFGNDTFGARSTGQSFTPGVGTTPATTLPALLLTKMELFHGNYASNAPNAQTYVNIYDGDPNGGGVFVGSSTTTFDTTGRSFRDPMEWSFPQLPLLSNVEYWAVFSSTDQPGGLNVEVSLETENRFGPPGPNIYTGGSGLIANIAQHPNSVDARFEIEFFNGLIGQFATSGSGCPGSNGTPTISSATTPKIGQPIDLELSNVSAAAAPLFVLGLSDSQWSGAPLPLPLAPLLPGTGAACLLQVAVDALLAAPVVGGVASVSVPVPNDPTLVGAIVYAQGAQLELGGASVTAKAAALLGEY